MSIARGAIRGMLKTGCRLGYVWTLSRSVVQFLRRRAKRMRADWDASGGAAAVFASLARVANFATRLLESVGDREACIKYGLWHGLDRDVANVWNPC